MDRDEVIVAARAAVAENDASCNDRVIVALAADLDAAEARVKELEAQLAAPAGAMPWRLQIAAMLWSSPDFQLNETEVLAVADKLIAAAHTAPGKVE